MRKTKPQYDEEALAAFEPPTQVQEDGKVTVACPVDSCHYTVRYGTGYLHDVPKALESFRSGHLVGHGLNRTPDLSDLGIVYKGRCSHCGYSFEFIDYDDSGRIFCEECTASWNQYGHDGRTDVPWPEEG